jgi:nicotinamidase/pyrazinamidase
MIWSTMRALLLVDLQIDFAPGGALAVPNAEQVVTVANALMDRFELVVATHDWHCSDHFGFAANHPGRRVGEVIELHGLRQILWPVHCVRDTAGADIIPDLDRARIKHITRHGIDREIDSYSAFFDNDHRKTTGLHDFLQARRVQELFIVGLPADHGVKFTAIDARQLGYETNVILEGVRGLELSVGDYQQAINEMYHAGVQIISAGDLERLSHA